MNPIYPCPSYFAHFFRFKFLYFPEFLEVGSAMIIREHLTKGVGVITKLL